MASLAMAEVKRIANLEENRGRCELGLAFGVTVENEATDLRGSILLDYLYDTFTFSVKKGFPWNQCYYTVELAKEVLEETIGRKLGEAVIIYADKCKDYQGKISSKNLEAYSNFFFQSFMVHFNLYQYVFTKTRENQTFAISKTVECPPEPAQFSTGKPEEIWDYEQKVKEIDDVLQQRQLDRQGNEKDENDIRHIYDELQLQPPIDLENMRTLVGDVARAHLTAATGHLKNSISETMQDLDLALQKSAIPKPQQLVNPSSPVGSEEEDALADLIMAFGKKAGGGRKSSLASQGPGTRSSLASRGQGQKSSAAMRGPSRTTKSRVAFRLQSTESRSQSIAPSNKKKISSSSKKNVT